MIGSLLQADLEEIIQSKDWELLRDALSEIPAPDIAEILTDLPPEDEGVIFRVLPRQRAADVFSYLPLKKQEELVQALGNAQVGSILNDMTPDDRTRLLEELPPDVTRKLLDTLSPEELKVARTLLGYPEGTAGRYMTPEYAALPPDITAREALERIRKIGRGKETLNIVYLINEKGQLLEDLRLGTLVLANPETMIGDIEERPRVGIPATAKKEEVLDAFEKYDRSALPVVDADWHMLGIITADDVLDVAEQAATEDIQKMGGMEALDMPYTKIGFWRMIRKRGGWLSVLFVGEMLTATAMGVFEHEIAKAVVLALFVPLIISSGGNSGSQATSLIIRALALKELTLPDWLRVLRRELTSGLVLGSLLGIIGFVRICVWYGLGWGGFGGHPYLVGLTVACSLIGVVMFGSVVGSMLPFILRRFGFDPATSSAPFVATLVDVTGLCIYFTVALMILKGTLLSGAEPEQSDRPHPTTAPVVMVAP
jgi:magnesium transporter